MNRTAPAADGTVTIEEFATMPRAIGEAVGLPCNAWGSVVKRYTVTGKAPIPGAVPARDLYTLTPA